MLRNSASKLSRIASLRGVARTRLLVTTALCVAFITATALSFAATPPTASTNVQGFFASIVGDWVGQCQQSTNGKQADDKFFHAAVKQLSPNTYVSTFEYYKLDSATKKPVQIGTSTVSTTINADGTAQNKITGKGTMLVDYKPKEQSHDLTETLTTSANGLAGKGTGKISVSGLPLNAGKNGKVSSATSTWSLKDGVLSIQQNINAGFKVLLFSKSFAVTASYTAKRGTDVASLMTGQMQASTQR